MGCLLSRSFRNPRGAALPERLGEEDHLLLLCDVQDPAAVHDDASVPLEGAPDDAFAFTGQPDPDDA
jgi:hypothetical protein